nr:jouberin-like [Onthophagus taurus]XP_022907846.1 jouberin-like [Onthophagus taurus]
MARGITNETKAKFEALLKAALKKSDSKSTQNLIEKSPDHGEDNKVFEETLKNEEEVANNFILNKFLTDDSTMIEVQRPIPKVRKKLLKQQSSESDKGSFQSNHTFVIEKESESKDLNLKDSSQIIRKFSSSSQSSRKTYDVNKEEIGDILVHDRKEAIQVLKINTNNRTASSISNTEYEGIELNELGNNEIFSEVEKSDKDDEKTSIRYVNEKKKKIKKKKKEIIEESSQNIVEITIHKTSRLKLKKLIHPIVKVFVINFETGEFVKMQNNLNPENIEDLKISTQPFYLQKERKLNPEWEETLIINIDHKLFTEEKNMLLFEIVDYDSFETPETDILLNWHHIAWGFLKIVAGDGSFNINKTLRLQLYKPGNTKKGSFCPVYDWWKQQRNKYPSTLYVTIKENNTTIKAAIKNLKNNIDNEYKHQEQSSNVNEYDNKDLLNSELKENEKEKVNEILTNLQEKTFKLPNKLHSELESGDEGCFALKFGNTGKYLVCSILSKETYFLVVYFLPNLDEYFKLSSHQDLIYNITFSKNDDLILASSADGTVSIWDLNKVKFTQMLPHPSFVYWCEIGQNFIATGCYDKIIRIWRLIGDLTWELYQELEGHDGYITCICINSKSTCIYSSDSLGNINCWEKDVNENFNLYKEIVLVELKNTVINQILLHKREKKLIVHARDNILRILDIKSGCVINWLEGGVNNRVRTICCFSQCNSYIFCGSESGSINVFNIDTGKLSAIYHPYKKFSTNTLTIHTLDFCSKSKILAFAHFGRKIPIMIYCFDPITTDIDLEVFDVQRKWRNAISSVGGNPRKTRSAEVGQNESKCVNLKEILDKIDRIIT